MTLTACFTPSTLRRSAVAVAIAASSAASLAASTFTFDPNAIGLDGTAVTADTITVADYAAVTLTDSGASFQESGFLPVAGFQLGSNASVSAGGLNSTYGLYFSFTASGTTNGGDPRVVSTTGTIDELSYTLWGYNGTATFSVDGGIPTETANNEIVLATGTLTGTGQVGTYLPTGTSFNSYAGLNASFIINDAYKAFFASPTTFYNMASTVFTNNAGDVLAFDGGFQIINGGGKVNFLPVAAVPEPETYALMLAGLCAIGFVARRRRSA